MNQRFQGEDIRRAHEQYAGNKLYAAICSIGADLEAELTGFGMCAEECFEEVKEVLSLIAEKGDGIDTTCLKRLWQDKYNQYRRFDRQVGDDEIRKVIGIVFGYVALALDSSESTFCRFTLCRMVQNTIVDNEPEGFDSTIDRIFDVPLEEGWFDRFMEENGMETYENLVFKENVDVGKVMRKLREFIVEGTIGAQIQWYVVYKVFMEKNWLAKNTQKAFAQQMNPYFETLLKCSVEDFKKVGSYFKHDSCKDWSPQAPTAPTCCAAYKGLADTLAEEFQSSRYAKPGLTINTPRHEKFR